jgi:hypothetical protein
MEGNGNNAQTPSTVLTLTITFDQTTGQVGVNGPIQNPLLCMGMMEMAKHAIHKFKDESAKGQRIVPATAMPLIRH